MKLRFGIREKFALTVTLLGLGAAFVVPELLIKQTEEIVTDHEIVDLQDEAALRCWEMVEAVANVRSTVASAAVEPELLGRMRRYLEVESSGVTPPRTDPGWWSSIECILRLEAGKGEFGEPLSPRERSWEERPPAEFVRRVLGGGGPKVSRIFGLDLPLRQSWPGERVPPSSVRNRVAAVWAGYQGEAGPGQQAAIFMLLVLPVSESPRHLAYLMDGEGNYLMFAAPGKPGALVDPFDRSDLALKMREALTGQRLVPGSVQAADYTLETAFRSHSDDNLESRRWRGAEARGQVQRGAIIERVKLRTPYFFLEGRVTDRFRDAIGRRELENPDALDQWWAKLQYTAKDAHWHIGGPRYRSKEMRILTDEEGETLRAKSLLETALRGEFPNDYELTWDPAIKCDEGDMQFMRFFLRQEDDDDPPYWFAYCAFRDELAASISHEVRELRTVTTGMSVVAGCLAFLLAFWMVRPLLGITRTAQAVASSSESAMQNRIEAVRRSLPQGRKDEVGDIARALDRLLVEVLNGHERLRQVNADLERRVDERTRLLVEANAQLRGLASAKDSFLASVSHELRQPLNSIFGFLQFLEFSDLTSQQRQDVGKVRNAATYLKGLINDILDYQKIIMGGMSLDAEELDSGEFFENLQASMEGQAGERGNTLSFVGVEGAGRICNDRQRLQQVLVNLLSNACKFTENGTVTLGIKREAAAGPEQSDWLVLEVKDTGRGMTPEEMSKLFIKFKKLAAREGNRSGTGLGLVISKGLCELMGGTISVSSEYGHGSTFTVRIPAELDFKEPLAALNTAVMPPSASAAAAVGPVLRGGKVVLVIDDDPAVREMIGRYLQSEGCEVLEAADGDAGLELARQHLPNLITLDVVMPGRDGWETLAELKADPATAAIPVAVITFVDQASRGYALGATDYIAKPIDWDRLGHVLRRHTEGESPVLVVDDDGASRELFSRALTGDGWKVVQAANGAEALRTLESVTPSAILLDLMMPVMDGFQFLAALRADTRWRKLPVIVITAMPLSTEERQRFHGTVTAVLEKNAFTLEQLLAEVLHTSSPPHSPLTPPHHGQNLTGG